MVYTIESFREVATRREVDTRNKYGFGGYTGSEYRLGKLVFQTVMVHTRWGEPEHQVRYVYGSRRVSKAKFLEVFKKMYEHGKIEV